MDKSQSVKIPNLKKVITFLGELVKQFDPAPDADHFGFITFNNKAKLVFNLADSQYHYKDPLLQKIASEPIKTAGGTRTDLALEKADQLFTEAEGDRPDKPNVMIVLTDGKPRKLPSRNSPFEVFAQEKGKQFEVSSLVYDARCNSYFAFKPCHTFLTTTASAI